MTGQDLTPRIKVTYMLGEDEASYTEQLVKAGDQYAETRTKEEEPYVDVHLTDKFVFVDIGRKVLGALSYAEIGHKADEMHQEIITIMARTGLGDIPTLNLAGLGTSGLLPDPE
jgi:hypothetical protein